MKNFTSSSLRRALRERKTAMRWIEMMSQLSLTTMWKKSLNCCSMLQNIGAFSASTHATDGNRERREFDWNRRKPIHGPAVLKVLFYSDFSAEKWMSPISWLHQLSHRRVITVGARFFSSISISLRGLSTIFPLICIERLLAITWKSQWMRFTLTCTDNPSLKVQPAFRLPRYSCRKQSGVQLFDFHDPNSFLIESKTWIPAQGSPAQRRLSRSRFMYKYELMRHSPTRALVSTTLFCSLQASCSHHFTLAFISERFSWERKVDSHVRSKWKLTLYDRRRKTFYKIRLNYLIDHLSNDSKASRWRNLIQPVANEHHPLTPFGYLHTKSHHLVLSSVNIFEENKHCKNIFKLSGK